MALLSFSFQGANVSSDEGAPRPAQYRQGRGLSLEERVSYQWAIEQVYWSHKLWPAGNQQPKPELEDVLPLSAVRRKVEGTLRKSSALEHLYKHTVTPEQLQAEMERMAKGTRQPGLLEELWSVLGNDPYVVAECLARPLLVDRLIEGWYGADPELHQALKARAQSELHRYDSPSQMRSMSGQYNEMEWVRAEAKPPDFDDVSGDSEETRVLRLAPEEWDGAIGEIARMFAEPGDLKRRGECLSCEKKSDELLNPVEQAKTMLDGGVSSLQEDNRRFYVTAVLSFENDRVKTATVEWRKVAFDDWWPGVEDRFEANVQTASYAYRLPGVDTAACANDTWKPTRTLPPGVYSPKAVWTGTELIVWGGASTGGSAVNTGARYNPATDTWTGMSLTNAPRRRISHTAVWTGTEMIIWGGCDTSGHLCGLGSGARYNPVTDTWRATSTANAPAARRYHTAVWTGSVMIVWGGCVPGFDGRCPTLNTGGVYNPATDSWMPTSTAVAPSPRSGHTAVWSGTVMIVWGATVDSSGGRYNPASNTWTPTSTIDVPSGRSGHTALWAGSEMIVWGGASGGGASGTAVNTGARYNPETDIWTPTTTAIAPAARYNHSAVWTGAEMIIWGGWDTGFGALDNGARYNPAANTWTSIGAAGAPSGRAGHVAAWTGSLMLIWGGAGDKSGGRYNPSADSWTATNNEDVGEARESHDAVWTGTEMIIWGGAGQLSGDLNTGARYTPATDNWRPTNAANAPTARYSCAPVWTGTEMITWGGGYISQCEGTGTGGRYNPTTDTWTATSTVGAPDTRGYHTTVWTGTEMIVWGGDCANTFNTGGRYNPATDTWRPTSTVNAPAGRYLHSAVWTGTEMIVWGGTEFGTGVHFNTGGRYNPATDSWQAIGVAGAPGARMSHRAVWTGSEMIVWGGWVYGSPSVYLDTGGRYNPTTNTWRPTSTINAPAARTWHTAIWTGAEMIVWGGVAGTSSLSPYYSTGGRYNPATDTWSPTNVTGAPGARDRHTAVWTGSEMIIWGGYLASTGTYTPTGGRYCVSSDPGFNILAAASSLTVAPGGNGSSAVTISSLNGFASAVSLSCAGAPAGVSWAFAPAAVTPQANGSTSSTLTLSVGSNVAPGMYSVLVMAASGNLNRTHLVELTVTAAPDFYATAYPEILSAEQGSSTSTQPRLWSQNGFNQSVTMSCTGAPAGVTFSFFFNPVNVPANGSTTNDLTITVAPGVVPGIYNLQVVGTSGNLVRTYPLQLTVLPAGCPYSLEPFYSPDFTHAGGSASVTVTTSPGCSWQSTSNADWITITSGANGTGTGAVDYTVAPNTGTGARFVRMTVAGKDYQVYQTAAPCQYSISPSSHSFTSAGWTGVISVSAPGACSWTATSNAPWITVLSISTTNGSGAVTYSAAPNVNGNPRSGTVTIAGLTFTVIQTEAARTCSYSISPTLQNCSSRGGSWSVNVLASAGCNWSATANENWIIVTSAPSGTGGGIVTCEVRENFTGNTRQGTITIGGQTLSVVQFGGQVENCAYSITPKTNSFPAGGGGDSLQVATAQGCNWQAMSNVGWIVITSGSAGAGPGTVSYTVAANPGPSGRKGSITVAGQTFSVKQK
jgi:N-acetylneuraminic acid mutarotase